ncbi:MAG: cupredoxin domain-containing protein [Actinobacteria bacterium]|nr:cupredoxin domain-containing protein [Actinomycetota bacterium]
MMIKRLLLGLLIAAAGAFSAVAISACDDNDEVLGDSAQEVDIRITDGALEPDRVEVTAGTIRFEIENEGDQTHELAVETTNEVEESGAIDPGGSVTMTVNLPEGQYAMYDPLENFRERGLEGTVIVNETTNTVERTVTEEGTDTVIEDTETDTVTREDTDTVTRRDTDTVTRQETVTRERTVPQDQQTTTTP